ncbi:hypothetical protein [Streptomyces achromogenes]|uniref:hypothetical protein n=1 Tax=Streptomyces achromogenes TaxID=67255 RepID=UPI00371C3BF6
MNHAPALPHRQLAALDERLAGAAARPVVLAETIVVDRGKVFVLRRSHRRLRTPRHQRPARPDPATHQPRNAPTDAGSVNTAELSWPLTTWQGWPRFATIDPPAPPQPGDPPSSRDERLAYHSTFVTTRAPAISQLAPQVRA